MTEEYLQTLLARRPDDQDIASYVPPDVAVMES